VPRATCRGRDVLGADAIIDDGPRSPSFRAWLPHEVIAPMGAAASWRASWSRSTGSGSRRRSSGAVHECARSVRARSAIQRPDPVAVAGEVERRAVINGLVRLLGAQSGITPRRWIWPTFRLRYPLDSAALEGGGDPRQWRHTPGSKAVVDWESRYR
jgi:hypothetical protein